MNPLMIAATICSISGGCRYIPDKIDMVICYVNGEMRVARYDAIRSHIESVIAKPSLCPDNYDRRL